MERNACIRIRQSDCFRWLIVEMSGGDSDEDRGEMTLQRQQFSHQKARIVIATPTPEAFNDNNNGRPLCVLRYIGIYIFIYIQLGLLR